MSCDSKEKCDAVILNFWWGNNYGASLTAYALQKMLQTMGYSSKLATYIFSQTKDQFYNGISYEFACKYLQTTKFFTTEESLRELNDITDRFIVGSDQVFRYEYTTDSFFLNFADANKVKLAFSASFGVNDFNCPKDEFKKYNYLLSRFDNVSVREMSGVGLCKDKFNINAKQIIDPVFALESSLYEDLIKNSNLNKENYILSYILDETPAIHQRVVEFAKTKNLEVVEIDKHQSVEDWLYLIKNASYVLTDSFHGACFSIIFNKNFLCLTNCDRGKDRFDTLQEILNIPAECFVDKDVFLLNNNNILSIDYKSINLLVKKYGQTCRDELSYIMGIKSVKTKNDIKKDIKEMKKIYNKQSKFQLFKRVENENFVRRYFLGIRVYKRRKNTPLPVACKKDEDKTLSCFLNSFIDIKSIKSKGNIKHLNDGNTQLLRIFDEVCKKHNLNYWLAYGTLLGAIRHQGYIPWDYDADVAMLRDDYEKLYDILEDELKNTEIEVYGISKIKKNYGNVIVLRNKGEQQFLNLDVIPFDKYYKKITNKEEENTLSNKLIEGKKFFFETFPLDRDIDSKNEIYEINSKLNKYTKDHVLEGKDITCDNPQIFKALMISPDNFFKVFYQWEDIFPLKRVKYEEIELNIPNNAQKILTDFYGDYMKFPNRFETEALQYWDSKVPSNATEIINKLEKIKI